MTADPIVAEVRRLREEHASKFGYDLQRIFADLKESEQERDASKSPLLMPPAGKLVEARPMLKQIRFMRPPGA
jgi:hypothetical protein